MEASGGFGAAWRHVSQNKYRGQRHMPLSWFQRNLVKKSNVMCIDDTIITHGTDLSRPLPDQKVYHARTHFREKEIFFQT